MKVIQLETRDPRSTGMPSPAVGVAACILAIASAWPSSAQAESFGEFRMLHANNTPRNVDPTIVHSGQYERDLLEVYGFPGGLGIAFASDEDETQDLDGNYRSRSYYGAFAQAPARGRRNRYVSELDHYSRYRKCNDDASLTLTITRMGISAYDGGPHDLPDTVGDYFVGIEPANIPQLVGSIEMEVVVYQRATRFAHLRGVLVLNLFVDRHGEERWFHAPLSLANSGGDFWQGAQLEFTTRPGSIPIAQHADYQLTEPHRITIDLASVPTAPSCAISEEDAPDDQGEFTVLVYLKSRAENSFFSRVESSRITSAIRDPADLNNNEDGVVVDVVGVQRLEKPGSLVPPSGSAFEPDPNCVAP
jgi:hypothetical protein